MLEHVEEASADAACEGGEASDGLASFVQARDALVKIHGRPLKERGWSRTRIAVVVNEKLAEYNHPPLSEGSIYRILQYGGNLSSLVPSPASKKRKTAQQKRVDHRRREMNVNRQQIRKMNAEMQYESMLNAPPNKLNNPFIRSAEQVQHLLIEMMSMDPETAVTQIPIERCRQWSTRDCRVVGAVHGALRAASSAGDT